MTIILLVQVIYGEIKLWLYTLKVTKEAKEKYRPLIEYENQRHKQVMLILKQETALAEEQKNKTNPLTQG